MGDIVERLRRDADSWAFTKGTVSGPRTEYLEREAADEIERLRAALYEVTTNGRWTEGEQRGEWAISNAVYETARDAVVEQSPPVTGKE